MGKRGGKKFGKRGGKASQRAQRQNWGEIDKHNEKYERYYNELGIVADGEREAFWETLRRNLPNSFRFTGSKSHAFAVQERLRDFYIPHITSIQYEGSFVEPPQPIPWYPDQLAWSMATPKNVVKRFAPLASFQKFLVAETEVGNISRQEVVSMIPPLLMDVRPGMAVLDMCAAPGSKSAQLMEMIHSGEEEMMKIVSENVKHDIHSSRSCAEASLEDDGRSTGLLIANDTDSKRAHMLIHQMKRLNSPNLIVTNHDATMYPSIKLPGPSEGLSKHRYLKFDRILADVPCSGDGTTRKNHNIWTDWVPGNALGLHITQLRILFRALQLLRVGGRVVYSTCSMNPVENEAVVASAIDRCGGPSNVEIIDCSMELPGLKRAPGLSSWEVMDKDGRIWSSWPEAEKRKQNEGIGSLSRVAETMFPPVGKVADLPLERCMRIYPHMQDTGGFFIAVLRKTSEIKARPEESAKAIPKASVAAVVGELDAKINNGTREFLEKIDALDPLVAPGNMQEVEKNATVAESSHQPPYRTILEPAPSHEKRGPDHLEAESPAKRVKLEDGSEAIMGDRPIHLPPRSVDREMPITEPQSEAVETPIKPSQVLQKRKPGQPLEEPFKYVDPDHEELKQIFAFYNISNRFPQDRFMVRNAQGLLSKIIYYSSALARDILVENEGRGIKFVHCGVRMFVRQDAQRPNGCRWRIQTDGLQLLESWVGPERCINLYKRETLRKLLVEMFPKLDGGSWKDLDEIGERARDITLGCCVLRIEPSDAKDGVRERMVVPLWRSLHSLNLMLPKEERRALLLRLFNNDTELINTTRKRENPINMPDTPPDVAEAVVADDLDHQDYEGAVTSLDVQEKTLPPLTEIEDEAIKQENLLLGQAVQNTMNKRETCQMAGDEEDRSNTTI